MARITSNVGEKIFSIAQWRGVNEAAEGEASLKFGEAAQMRNFRVTSGGALKKRPGSMNVAGLLSAYIPHVREGASGVLFTEYGGSTARQMYPRMIADETGAVKPAGSPAEVTSGNAEDYRGYYYERNGCWQLDRCVVTPGTGSEELPGGRMTPGDVAQVYSGTERWTRSGGSSYTGTREVVTYPDVSVSGGGAAVSGASVRRSAPGGTSVGFETTDVGGYFLQSGRLYRYYGARVDSYAQSFSWKKYKCSVNSYSSTYYTEGDWEFAGSEMAHAPETAFMGWQSYTFNSSNGTFSTTGGVLDIPAGSTGKGYFGGGATISCCNVSKGGKEGSSYCRYSTKSANGPFYSYYTTYSRGDYIGTVTVPEGENPEAGKGSYVTSFYYDGGYYTVMLQGQEYYCYIKDESAGAAEYTRSYSFHARPMSVSADRYDWYFNGTYSTPNEKTDTAVRGIWSGFVGGREVVCAACGGYLWELRLDENGVWGKVPAGDMDTSEDVDMFGFDEKLYILNGEKYLVWDGERLEEVAGYRPLVSVSVEPSGGGTLLESVNRLTAGRRCRFSPDGEATVFHLPERDIASVDWVTDLTAAPAAADEGAEGPQVMDGENARQDDGNFVGSTPGVGLIALSDYTVDPAEGTVTFKEAPAKGVNTLEIAWSVREDYRAQVCAMRFAELYNGAQDSRVFLYGDGTNRAFYSGLDHEGRPRADYFPDLYEVSVGDANTPITAMIRHYDRLLAFKLDSAWSIGYDTITLVDGSVTAGFYVAPVNRAIGNCAWGQARLVLNRPRTLDGRSVIEWKSTSSSGITGDQRNAERVSQRVDSSIRRFDLTKARTFYDKFSHEYFVIGEDGTAIVQNLDVDAWYVYTGLDVTCMINYRDGLYYGTRDGYLRHFSDEYFSDNGAEIDAYWESGAMSFGEDFRRKYSAMLWVGIKPEDNGYLEVTAKTDRKSEFAVYSLGTSDAGAVPEMDRIKLKAKKFTYYKLILRNNTPDRTATVVSADIRVRGTGYVR